MTVVRLEEEDLDEEDLAILKEVAQKGYYHNRPKSVACAPPKRIDDPPQRLIAQVATTDQSKDAKGRAVFDDFQAKWDRFDNEEYLCSLEADLVKSSMKAKPKEQAQSKPSYSNEKDAVKAPSTPLMSQPGPGLDAEFKVLLVGEAKVGKTALLKRHSTGEFWKSPSAASREVQQLRFHTNCGIVAFNVWELSPGAPERAFYQASGAIVMFDFTTRASYRSVLTWIRDIQRYSERMPVVLLGNKADGQQRRADVSNIRLLQKKHHLQYYEMSVLSSLNIEKCFLWLARRLTNCAALQFIGGKASSPEATPDASLAKEHARLLEEAASVPLDENDF